MSKVKTALVVIILIFHTYRSFSQSSPSLQINIGLAFPQEGLKGELVSTNDSGVSNINGDFIQKNYAASTGATISGNIKFPFGRLGYFKGLITGSYSNFNIFRRNFIGTTYQNNVTVPVSFDSRFSVSTVGLGAELTPLPNSKISPYLNTNFTISILSLSLLKNDVTSVIFNDAFRAGLLTTAGVNVNISSEYSIAIGMGYHLSNIFLKSHKESFGDRIEFNRESIPINDDEGRFYTNLSNPDLVPMLVNGKSKNVNWWNFTIGLNIVLGKSKKK